jgi:mRNA interferase RelE/StbE
LKPYRIEFHQRAAKQWRELDSAIQKQFQKKLDKVAVNPHIASARMRGWPHCYRLKLRKAGMRLTYRVYDEQVVVLVVTVGKRENNDIYDDFEATYTPGIWPWE